MEIVKSYKGSNPNAKGKANGSATTKRMPKGLITGIRPNEKSIIKLRKEGVAIRDGMPEYGQSDTGRKPRTQPY